MTPSMFPSIHNTDMNSKIPCCIAIQAADTKIDISAPHQLLENMCKQFSQDIKDRKVYSCRICKVPAKGHVCPYRNPDGTKDSQLKPLSPQIPVHVADYELSSKTNGVAIPCLGSSYENIVTRSIGDIPPQIPAKRIDSIPTGVMLSSSKDDSILSNRNVISFGNISNTGMLNHNINRDQTGRKSKKLKVAHEPFRAKSVTSSVVVTPNAMVPKTIAPNNRAGEFISVNNFAVKSRNEKVTSQNGVPAKSLQPVYRTIEEEISAKYAPKTKIEPNQINSQSHFNISSCKNEVIRHEMINTTPTPNILPHYQFNDTQKYSNKMRSRKVYSCKLCGVSLKGHRCLKALQSPQSGLPYLSSNPQLPLQQNGVQYQPFVQSTTNTPMILPVSSNSTGNIPAQFSSRIGSYMSPVKQSFVPPVKQTTRRRKKKSKIGSTIQQIPRNLGPVPSDSFGPSSLPNHYNSAPNPGTNGDFDTLAIANDCRSAELKHKESSKNGLLAVLAAAAAMDDPSSHRQVNDVHHQEERNYNVSITNQTPPVTSSCKDLAPRPLEKQENEKQNCFNQRSRSPSFDKIEINVEGDRVESSSIQEFDKQSVVWKHNSASSNTNRESLTFLVHKEEKEDGEFSLDREHVEIWSRNCTGEFNEEIDIILENYKLEQHYSQMENNENSERHLLLLLQNKLAY